MLPVLPFTLGMLKVGKGTRRPSKINRLLDEATMRFKPYADFAAGRGPKPADFTAAIRHVTVLSTGTYKKTAWSFGGGVMIMVAA